MPDPTPTERAITRLRARRSAGCSQDNDCGLLLAAYDQLEGNAQELHLQLASAERHAEQMDAVIDSLGIPGAAAVTA